MAGAVGGGQVEGPHGVLPGGPVIGHVPGMDEVHDGHGEPRAEDLLAHRLGCHSRRRGGVVVAPPEGQAVVAGGRRRLDLQGQRVGLGLQGTRQQGRRAEDHHGPRP